ncbi:hypothetical protein [Leptolyngbya sp. FACHB-8]|uniref:hypothetical protein n=1 Tax=unclassified Leptolyngbya TaxID=2650499 RepID=UPI0016892A2B|nr:hypothetical protein [Leptolyngbya sp. FACHB-8]MBD1912541.1 hypothetical protein [Leptolyngbya sp. FACHB-8]
MVKFDFLFKQALVAMGLLASALMVGQAGALAATPESEGSTATSQAGMLVQEGAIAPTIPTGMATPQPTKNWDAEVSSAANPTQIAQAVDPMDSGTMDAPMNEPEPGAPSITESMGSPVVADEPIVADEPVVETPAPFALNEDSAAAVDLESPANQEPASLSTDEPNTLQLIQTQDGTEIAQRVGTRYRYNFIGIGPNVGITGDTAIGDTSFAIVSRFAVTPAFSVRPAVFIEDDVSILLPVTYDLPISGPGGIAPYVGGGLTLSTGDDSNLDLLLSAGLDIPLNENFAITAGLNAAPFDEFDLGVFAAVAYTFGGVITTDDAVEASLSEAESEVEETAAELGLSSRRNNPSFIGVGANLGIGGDTALGDTSFAVVSKITVAPSISIRPSLLIEDGVSALVPVTYDFDGFSTEFLSFYPFIGAGTAFSFDDDDNEFDLLLTAGVDIPITSNLAFTSSVNAGLLDSFDIGALLGIVYTFSSF